MTGKTGMLQSMGLQRVRHNLAAEQQLCLAQDEVLFSLFCMWMSNLKIIKPSLFLLRLISGRESAWRPIGVSYGDNKRKGDDRQV